MLVLSTFSPEYLLNFWFYHYFEICIGEPFQEFLFIMSFLQALGMKVVNIVPEEMLKNAKTKMIAAIDWSLQRWYEEGKVHDQDMEEEEGHNEVDSNIERKRSKRANDTYEEEDEDKEDVLDPQGQHDQPSTSEDNLIFDLIFDLIGA